MTHSRASRHHMRTWLRAVVKYANGQGWPVVYVVMELE